MSEENWEAVSREVVSLFSAITKHTPNFIVCLDKYLILHEFEDAKGWTKWTNDGLGLLLELEESSAKFLIFSDLGLHELIYFPNKKPEIKHILEAHEIPKFKLIKSRQDRLEIQIKRKKDFILGKMDFKDSYKLKFNSEQWDYLQLRRKLIIGKNQTEELIKKLKSQKKAKAAKAKKAKRKTVRKTKKGTKKTEPWQLGSMVYTSRSALDLIRSKFEVPVKKPPEAIADDYEESIKNAKKDIKALKKPANRKLAENALDSMRDAASVIKRCDKDVTSRNKRLRKLKRECIALRKKPMRKSEKTAKIDELTRKIKMMNNLNDKELMVKSQKVGEFCGLREAILTIRTNEQNLKPQEINLMIDNVILSDTHADLGEIQVSDSTKPKKKLKLKSISKLVDSGNKDEWIANISFNLKNKIKMEFPPLDEAKCKFKDYGYRQLIELIIESPDFLRIITDVEEISGFTLVQLNHLIRGDNSTLRGLEALCSLLINNKIHYNPVSETDFKYLNLILNSLTTAKKDGINKKWSIKTESKTIKIAANFDKENREWIYSIS